MRIFFSTSLVLSLAVCTLLLVNPATPSAQEARPKYSGTGSTMLAPQVQKIEVAFPKEVRRYGRSVGPIRVAKLKILVQQNGKAGDVQIAQSSGLDAYDSAALSAARRATYLPATDHGMPVESRMDYDVSFGLLCDRAAGNFICDYRKYPTTCSATVCTLLIS